MITAHHLVFGRKRDFSDFLYSEINSIISYLPITKNGTVTYTTDRKGGNTAIQLGSGYLETSNNLPISNVWSISYWVKSTFLTTQYQHHVLLAPVNNGDKIFLSGINYNASDNQFTGYILMHNIANQRNLGKTIGLTAHDNTWKHVVMIFDTTQPALNEVKMYVNGVLQSLKKIDNEDNTYSFSPLKFAIGWSDLAYKGALSDVKIYNRPLTPTEVINLYNE